MSHAARCSADISRALSKYGLSDCHWLGAMGDMGALLFFERIDRNALSKVDARLVPLPLDGALRKILHSGNFGETEAAEKFQVDYFGKVRLDLRQFIQGIADD